MIKFIVLNVITVNAMKRDMGVFNPSAQDNPLYTSSQVLSMLSQPGVCKYY